MQRYPRHECKSIFSVWLLSNFFLQTKMVWIGKIKPDKNHCKLTKRRRSISIDITVTALWLRCSSSSDFTHKCKESKYIPLHIINSKHFCSFQYLFNKISYDQKHISYQYYLLFTLAWREMSSLILDSYLNIKQFFWKFRFFNHWPAFWPFWYPTLASCNMHSNIWKKNLNC